MIIPLILCVLTLPIQPIQKRRRFSCLSLLCCHSSVFVAYVAQPVRRILSFMVHCWSSRLCVLRAIPLCGTPNHVWVWLVLATFCFQLPFCFWEVRTLLFLPLLSYSIFLFFVRRPFTEYKRTVSTPS